jgi:hypothetical protein
MNLLKIPALLVVVLLTMVIFTAPALAGAILTTPDLPPSDGDPLLGYVGPASAVFFGGVSVSDSFLSQFVGISRNPVGPDEMQNFGATLTLMMDGGGGPVLITLTGPVTTIAYGKVSNTTGMFDTEIIEMSLTGDIGGIPVEMRESPSLGSLGQTTIDDIGGGLYHIDSFFDVFTELSINGGPFDLQADEPLHMELARLPEPATLSLLALGGIAMLRRKRK